MFVYLPALLMGAICFMISARLKAQGKEREAGFLIGIGIVLMLTSIIGAGLSIAGVF